MLFPLRINNEIVEGGGIEYNSLKKELMYKLKQTWNENKIVEHKFKIR